MENEFDELENSSKGRGWHNRQPGGIDHVRHVLAGRGIKTGRSKDQETKKLEQIKQLSEAGELDWQKFQKIYGNDAENKLQQLFDDGKIEMEMAETEPDSRQRYGETRLELEEEGEVKTYTIERDTPITVLNISY